MFFVICGLLVVVTVMTLIGVAAISASRAGSRIAGELARIREAGEPASAIELEEHYQLPPGVEDTTDLWIDAMRPLDTKAFGADAGELPVVGTGESEIPPPGQPWDDLEAVEALLRKYDASLGAMHEAAELDGAACYPVEFGDGFFMLLDHVQRVRGGARLLTLQAHVAAHRGDPRGAARSIRAIFSLARSLEREPVLVSLMVRLACDGIAREQLKKLLPSVGFSDADLARLQDVLRAIDYHDGLYRGMLGERAMGIHTFENPNPSEEENPIPAGGFWRFTQGGGFVFYLEHMGGLVVAAKQPWPQALRAADQAEAKLDDLAAGASPLTKVTHVFPLLLAPAIGAAFEATARNVAMNGAADAAIAIELYRRRHGKLPERLKQLVPDFLPQIPTDPFDGQPLKYVVREEEYLIYSVGRDRVDNGGTADPEHADFEPDMVFRVRRP